MNITTKFSLGQKVYVIKQKTETNYDTLIECYYCSGTGNKEEFDASNNLYECECANCDGTGKTFDDKVVHWVGSPIVTSITMSGHRNSPKIEYGFTKYREPLAEEFIFATEAEALAKCKELNNEQT